MSLLRWAKHKTNYSKWHFNVANVMLILSKHRKLYSAWWLDKRNALNRTYLEGQFHRFQSFGRSAYDR